MFLFLVAQIVQVIQNHHQDHLHLHHHLIHDQDHQVPAPQVQHQEVNHHQKEDKIMVKLANDQGMLT